MVKLLIVKYLKIYIIFLVYTSYPNNMFRSLRWLCKRRVNLFLIHVFNFLSTSVVFMCGKRGLGRVVCVHCFTSTSEEAMFAGFELTRSQGSNLTLLLCLGSPSCHCMWYMGIFGFVIKLVLNSNCYHALWFWILVALAYIVGPGFV